ncbi:MAG: DUF3098 domain-containing protein [Ferruginibacter sp.]|nr:DUF3098 domain-containing protein [Ferruginibacter sp.]
MLKENKQIIQANNNLFGKENYIWMIAGLVVITLGFILMAGGKSADPKVFDPKEVYSTTRITIAPFLVIAGFVLEIIGIMKKTKALYN